MWWYLYAGELPRRKNTTFRPRRKFEIKKPYLLVYIKMDKQV